MSLFMTKVLNILIYCSSEVHGWPVGEIELVKLRQLEQPEFESRPTSPSHKDWNQSQFTFKYKNRRELIHSLTQFIK